MTKLISLGGRHYSGRRILFRKKGRGWVLYSSKEPINWAKIICYAIVTAIVIVLIASLVQYANTAPDAEKEPVMAVRKNFSTGKVFLVKYEETQEKTRDFSTFWEEPQSLAFEESQKEDLNLEQVKESARKDSKEQEEAPKIAVMYYDSGLRTTEDRIRFAMKILTEEYGFTAESAAAIVGNALVESQLKANAANGEDFFGLFQWSVYWWPHIQTWLLSNGYNVYSFEGQIRAAVKCSKSGCMTQELWAELKELTNVEQATELFAVYYEGCIGGNTPTEYYLVGKCYQALNLRKSEAKEVLKVYYGENYNGQKPYFA